VACPHYYEILPEGIIIITSLKPLLLDTVLSYYYYNMPEG